MDGIKSAAIRGTSFIGCLGICLFLVPGFKRADAQTIHADDPEIEIETLVEEPSEFERLLDRLWTIQPAVQSNWGWQSDGIRPTHLGNRHQWQVRLTAAAGAWRAGFIADKDMGEPWGSGALPWQGPELKRWHVSRQGQRGHLLIGSFRIQHGFGLVSGRRPGSMPSRSNPLRLPGKLASVRGYSGSAGGPVRSGLLLGLEGGLGAIRFWQSADRVAASTSLDHGADRPGMTVITDLSGTSAFVTESSVTRRNALSLSSSGVQAAIAGHRWQIAAIAEHVRLKASRLGESTWPFGRDVPTAVFAGSVSSALILGKSSTVFERTVTGRDSPAWRAAWRWKGRVGSGVILDVSSNKQRIASPYSGRGRLFTDQESGFTVRAAARWRKSTASDWTVRSSLLRKHHPDGVAETRNAALDWMGSIGSGASNRAQAGLSLQSTNRWDRRRELSGRFAARFNSDPTASWNSGVQISAGFKRDRTGENGLTGLVGLSVQWLPWDRSLRPGGKALLPDWSALILIRRASRVRTMLYATQPVISGGFPVLAGSSPLLAIIHRLRWRPAPDTEGELLLRWDRRSRDVSIRHSLRLMLQVRKSL